MRARDRPNTGRARFHLHLRMSIAAMLSPLSLVVVVVVTDWWWISGGSLWLRAG
jgi:hypothetical protein